MRSLLVLGLLPFASATSHAKIGKTTVLGTTFDPAGVEFFGGMPYAKPPVGELSLRPPVVATTFGSDKFHAENFGFACLQAGLPADTVSLDCLTINIFRPAGSNLEDRLPVMLWIHGGGFFAGASSQAPYNGTEIVSYSVKRGTPVIFASLNYRLGALGFPQGVEAAQSNVLNLGLHDQLAGLKWLKSNVNNFGGDESKITVFGQSAGATSINLLLLQDTLGSLARAVIIESDVIGGFYLPERNENLWQEFVSIVPECAGFVNTTNTIQCLRDTNTSSLLNALVAGGSAGFQPVIDGPGGIIPDRPSKAVPLTQLPTLIGSNLDEATLFSPQNINSVTTITNFLASFTPLLDPATENKTITEILHLYPDVPALGSPFSTGNNTFGLSSQYKRYNAIWGDSLIQAARRSFTQRMKSEVKLFVYHFSDPDALPIPGIDTSSIAPGSLGVTHSAEIPYVFNQLETITPTATVLSGIMQDYWISFATSLDPNDRHGHKRPIWPQYTKQHQVLMELNGIKSEVVPDTYRQEQIAFLQRNSDLFHH